MAILKCVASGCPLRGILSYVTRREATEDKLIGGVNCCADSALDEFIFVKKQFHKEDGRQYYHFVQSFSPEDELTPEIAHEIGLRFAESFPEYQVLVATHVNTGALHNHIILNSVNMKNGRKYHQSRDDLLRLKEYSNQLCMEYGLSVTEVKAKDDRGKDRPTWKKDLVQTARMAMLWCNTKEGFIEYMEEHGYKIKWEDNLKYITYTTPDGHVIRDNKLFDERLHKDNLELYFALGGCDFEHAESYYNYRTPPHDSSCTMTLSTGLLDFFRDLLTAVPPQMYYVPAETHEMNDAERKRLEAILGKKIEPAAYAYYCVRPEDEETFGLIL